MSLMTLTCRAFSFAEKCARLAYDSRPITRTESRIEKTLLTNAVTVLALATFALATVAYVCYRKTSEHKIIPLDPSEFAPMNPKEATLLFEERASVSLPVGRALFSYSAVKQFLFARYIGPSAYLLYLILGACYLDRQHYNHTSAETASPHEAQLKAVIEEAGCIATAAYKKAEKDKEEAVTRERDSLQVLTSRPDYSEIAKQLFCIPKFN